MPEISIIIPCLNEAEELPNLLESIKKQTYKDYEVIVADAGSSDKTITIAEDFGAKVVPGGMPGPGRNRGAEVANGTWLFFFDADVVIPKDFLENAHKEIQEKFVDLATCEFKPISDLRLDKVMFHFANLTVKLNQSINPRAAGFCIFITRRLFNRINGFDETLKLAEDHDLVTRASKLRPLRVLESTHLNVSVRRLQKEGRFALMEKYMVVEKHLLTKGAVREDIVEYEFGNFKGDDTRNKKLLDEIEDKIIQLEGQYNQFAEKMASKDPEKSSLLEGSEKLKAGIETLAGSIRIMFSKPDKKV